MRTCLGLAGWVVLAAAAWAAPPKSAPAPQGVEFFEKKIRPVLVEHCYSCHSAEARKNKKLRGGLVLDTRDGVRKGGDSGPALVPGRPAQSLLVKAVRWKEADLRMPPRHKLPEAAIADLEKWVAMGAPDPRDGTAGAVPAIVGLEKGRKHWAFQPLRLPPVPAVKARTWGRTPIDAFLLERMEKKGVTPSRDADPRALLRRLHLDLIGLPPTPKESEAFARAWSRDAEAALAKAADDLLGRPQYGERWGRHWLDVAGYAETQGYERDELKPFAWRYRDYVIDAFNSDIPYTQFVREQLAGDEIENSDTRTQVATTFLRLGTYDTIAADGKAARYDNLDDTLGVTASAFLGLTIQCARCHDHKFEPISQEDYYRLLCVFEPLPDPRGPVQVGSPAEREAHDRRIAAWEATFAKEREPLDRLRLQALERLAPDAALPKKGRIDAKQREEAIRAYKTPADKRDRKQLELTSLEGGQRWDQLIRAAGTAPEKSAFERLNKEIRARADKDKPQPLMAFAAGEGKAVAGRKGGATIPAAKPAKDKTAWPTTRVMIRGEVNRPGKEVTLGVPAVLAAGELAPPTPTGSGSGRRLWLAEWMTGQAHPLLARVIVNRLWQHHFGRGLMPEANEFGVSAGNPSHPELLEWLAADFAKNGWKLKRLHRQIVLSRAYRLSAVPAEMGQDADGSLYSRWRSRRLEAEAIRDSILAVSGKLNLARGGPSIHPPLDSKVVGASAGQGWLKSDEKESARRSVYVFAKRAIPLPELELLDLPDASVSTPRRQVATTSVQALLLMNGRLATEQSAFLAARLEKEAGDSPRARVRLLWQLALGREPRAEESAAALEFLSGHPRKGKSEKNGGSAPLASLCLVVLNTNEFVYLP